MRSTLRGTLWLPAALLLLVVGLWVSLMSGQESQLPRLGDVASFDRDGDRPPPAAVSSRSTLQVARASVFDRRSVALAFGALAVHASIAPGVLTDGQNGGSVESRRRVQIRRRVPRMNTDDPPWS